MKFLSLSFLCAFAVLASASPLAAREHGYNLCQEVNFLVTILKLQKATPFCSSFLGIPTVTVVATSTSTSQITTVVPGPTVLTTIVTSTSVFTDKESTLTTSSTTTTTNVPSTVDLVATVSTTSTSTFTLRKRGDKRKAPIPDYLKIYETSAISMACGCLNIPTRSTTITTVTSTLTTAITTGSPTTSSILTVTSTSTTTTSTSVTLATLVIMQTIPTTSTSTTTIVAISVSTYIPTPCLNPTLLDNGYFPQFQPHFTIVPIANGYTAQRCCARCYETQNCVSWAFGGFIEADYSSCYSILNTAGGTYNPAPAPLADICPLGITVLEQLAVSEGANMEGEYGFGPCDLGGLQFE